MKIIKAKNTTQIIQLNSTYTSSFQGQGAPTITPQFIGQQYIDKTSGGIYTAVGTDGYWNWGFTGMGLFSSFNKNTIAGLISWYKADDGPSPTTEGTNITSWLDSSDTANTLTGVSGTRAYTSNVQNGLAGIRFVANSYILGSNLTDVTQPGTIFLVFKGTDWATGGYQCIFSAGSGSWEIYKNTGNTNGMIASGTNLVGSAVVNNTTSMITGIFNGGSSSIKINNNSTTVGNAGTGVNVMRPLIGTDASGAAGFTGYVFEVLVYTGALTTTNQDIVRTYLNNKWGIY